MDRPIPYVARPAVISANMDDLAEAVRLAAANLIVSLCGGSCDNPELTIWVDEVKYQTYLREFIGASSEAMMVAFKVNVADGGEFIIARYGADYFWEFDPMVYSWGAPDDLPEGAREDGVRLFGLVLSPGF